MLRQTVSLFFKALIIGVILQAGIHYAGQTSAPPQKAQSPSQIQTLNISLSDH